MRCKACNVQLSDAESVRKDPQTGEYYDLCSSCFIYSEEAVMESKEVPLEQIGITDLDTY